MSREIDERVVQMKFESGQFEKNIQTSIHSLDELKKGLDFKDASKGFEKLDSASSKVNIDPITQAVQQLNSHFNLLGITAINVMNRISNAAINTGEKLIKSLTIDQITPGWQKYADKTTAVQTIMAATANEFSDTAKQMEVVNEQLDKLNWFTDETSYNFVDMVSNISKFTSNNISLEKSVTAMQGIANWAAKSGANAQQASHAMYNLSQALASGAVMKLDWKSIENANMSTTEFKKTAAETAVQLGMLKKVGDDTFQTLNGKVGNTIQLFGDLMQHKWFTSDVLIETLKKYGGAVDILQAATEKYDTTASHMIKDIQKYTIVLNKARSEAAEMEKNEADTLAYVNEQTSDVIESLADKWDTTFEDAKETLAQFDDEMIQFSLDAFKYGQEAKTFAEAIGSVTDAVSTKWMKTFELLFGNYQEAKVFWTDIANALYDIFAASGDARNELLEDWAAIDGRKYFTDAIYATLAAILAILAPIKAAWNDVFGSMTAERLKDLTVRLRDFMLRLTASEETMQKIARTFRGLFSVLDLIRTVVGEIAGGVLQALSQILGAINVDIWELVASSGDFVYMLTRWIKQTGIIRVAINALAGAIVGLISGMREFIVKFSNWGPAQKAIEKLQSVAKTAFGVIGDAIFVVIDVLQWLFQQLQNFQFPNSFEDISNFFVAFANKILESLSKIGIGTGQLGDGFTTLGEVIKKTAGVIVSVFAVAAQGVTATLDLINRYLSKVDWAGVFLAAFGVGTVVMLWKFVTALQGFATALQNVTGVGKSAKGSFDAIKGYFTALKENIQANNILKTAIAIGVLAAACGLLARMDAQGVAEAGWAILKIAGAVSILTMIFDKWSSKRGKSDNKGILAMMQFVLALAVSMVAISFALNNLQLDNIAEKGTALGVALVVLAGTAAIFSVVAKPIQTSAKSMVGITASLLLMIHAIKSIKPEDAPAMLAALPVVSALMLVMALLTKLMATTSKATFVSGNMVTNMKNGSGLLSIIGLVAALKLMIGAIKSLGAMQPDVAAKGIILMIPLVVMLKTLMNHITTATKEAKSAGKMVLYIAAAVNLLYFSVKNLAQLDKTELIKGLALTALLMALTASLVLVSKYAGQYAAKAGLMILEIAGALMAIQLVVKTLGHIDLLTAVQGTAAVYVLLLGMSKMLQALSGNMQANNEGIKALTKVMIMVGIISALTVALTYIDPFGALAVCAGLYLVFKSFGEMVGSMNTSEDINIKRLLMMLAAVGVIGFTIKSIAKIGDWKLALAAAGGLSLVFVALGAMMKIADKATGGLTEKKFEPMKKMVWNIAGVLAALTILMALVGPENIDAGKIAILTGCMSGLMVAFGLMSGIMGSMKGKPDSKNADAMVSMINAFMPIMIAFSAIAGFGSKAEASFKDVLYLATGMSEIMIALGIAARTMDGVKPPEDTAGLMKLTFFVGAMTAIMGMMALYASQKGADLTDTLTLAGSMSLLLLAIAAAVRIADGKEFKMKPAQLLTIGAIAAGLGGILAIFDEFITNPGALIPLAVAMSALLLSISAAAVILGHFPAGGGGAALQAIPVILAVIGGMTALMVALGGLQDLCEGKLSGWLENGASMLSTVGSGIGSFVGSIISGFASGLTSGFEEAATNISAGMTALQPFFDGLDNMPDDILELGTRLVDTITKIANPQFKTAITQLKGVADAMDKNSGNLESVFSIFGKAMKSFADASAGIDLVSITNGVEAAVQLSQLEANLPSKGGLMSTILGEDDLESFGGRLQALGRALWNFSVYGKLIDVDAIGQATTASKKLQEIESKLPAKDGALQAFFGQDGFDKFGTRLASYGAALVAFSDAVSGQAEGSTGLAPSAIDKAITATKQLSEIESGLQSSGSVVGGFFFGNSDLGTFGQRLSDYGSALATFSASVAGQIDLIAIGAAINATRQLSDLESELDTHGGWNSFWNGDNTFGQFGTNLRGLGTALQNFSTNISKISWQNIDTAISYIERMTAFEKLSDASSRTLSTLKTLMADIVDTIKAQKAPVKDEAHDMAYWLADGFAQGMADYEQIALNAAIKLANAIISAMNAIFQIHSPSVVMNEMGHWVVKGLGEGITEDMTAEEAAEKKAQDIISAFQSGLSKMNAKLDISNLEYQLWEKTEGLTATESEKASKQLEQEVEKLKAKAQEVSMMRTAMNAVLETAGEESEAYQTAYKNYLQSQIDMYDQQAAVDELQGTTLQDSNATWAQQAQKFAQLQAENAEAFKFMGKSEEDLRKWAAEQVGGGFERQLETNALLEEYRDAFDRLGYSQEQRIAEVDKMLGPETAKEIENKLYDTNAIIQQAMEETSYTLEEAVSKSLSSAVGKGGAAGAAAAAGVGPDIGEALQNSVAGAMEDIDFSDALGKLGLDKMLEYFNDPSQITESIGNFFSGENGILGAIKTNGKTVTDEVTTWGGHLLISIFGEDKLDQWYEGAKSWLGDSGVKGGLEDKEALAAVETSAEEVPKAMQNGVETALKNEDGSAVAYELGETVPEQFGEGETDPIALKTLETKSETVADRSHQPIEDSVPEYKTTGENAIIGLANGMEAKRKVAIDKSIDIAKACVAAQRAVFDEASPSKVTAEIGAYATEGLAIGLLSKKEMAVNSAEEVANSTVTALDYTKDLINDVLANDEDFSPTITPVLDLDQLTQDAKSIPNLLSRKSTLNLSATARRANQINSSIAQNRQNGIDAPNETNYNFVQNNYSPKSLNRVEIYRQTQNQFAQLKGATKIR